MFKLYRSKHVACVHIEIWYKRVAVGFFFLKRIIAENNNILDAHFVRKSLSDTHYIILYPVSGVQKSGNNFFFHIQHVSVLSLLVFYTLIETITLSQMMYVYIIVLCISHYKNA